MPKAPLPHPPPKTIDRHECCCKESERLQHYPQAAQGGFAVAPCTPSRPLRKQLSFCAGLQGALRSPPAPLRRPFGSILVSYARLCRGLCGRSATSIVASYACSFRLMRSRTQFAPQAQVRSLTPAPLRTPFGSSLVYYARLCRGLCGRPLDPFACPFGSSLVCYESKKLNQSIFFEGTLKDGLRRVPRGDRKAPWK